MQPRIDKQVVGEFEKIDPSKSVDANARFLAGHHGNVRLLNDDGSFPGPEKQTRAAAFSAMAAAEAKRARKLAKRRA